MKLSQLHYFQTVAETGSFTKAAEQLALAQPTLSRAIARLEEELGHPLLIRKQRAVKLTPEGERLLPEAISILKQIDALPALLKDGKANQPEAIKIGYQKDFNIQKLYQKIETFKEWFPHQEVIVSAYPLQELKDKFAGGELDFALGLSTYFDDIYQIEEAPFMPNALQAVVPKSHAFASRTGIHFSDLIGEAFIMLERKCSPLIVDYVITQCTQMGFSLQVNYYVDTIHSGLDLVAAGNGLCFIYSGMLYDGLLEHYQLQAVTIEEDTSQHDFSLFSHKELGYHAQKLRDLLRS